MSGQSVAVADGSHRDVTAQDDGSGSGERSSWGASGKRYPPSRFTGGWWRLIWALRAAWRLAAAAVLEVVPVGSLQTGDKLRVQRQGGETESGRVQLRTGDLNKLSTRFASCFSARIYWVSRGVRRQNQL